MTSMTDNTHQHGTWWQWEKGKQHGFSRPKSEVKPSELKLVLIPVVIQRLEKKWFGHWHNNLYQNGSAQDVRTPQYKVDRCGRRHTKEIKIWWCVWGGTFFIQSTTNLTKCNTLCSNSRQIETSNLLMIATPSVIATGRRKSFTLNVFFFFPAS